MGVTKGNVSNQYKEDFKETIKTYFIPSTLILTMVITRLYVSGILEDIYRIVFNKPKMTTLGANTFSILGILFLIITEVLIVFGYIWLKNINKIRKDEIEDQDKEDDNEVSLLKKSFDETITTSESNRIITYIWMTVVGGLLLLIIRELSVPIIFSLLEQWVVHNPDTYVGIFLAVQLVGVIINWVFKLGLLVYTTHATYKPKNLWLAIHFTFTKAHKTVYQELKYYIKIVIGLILLVIPVLYTNTQAHYMKVDSWGNEVRDFEKKWVYGK